MKIPSVLGAFALIWFAIPASASPSLSAQQPKEYAALAAQDQRLARIAQNMLAANAPLCTRVMPLTGMILHSRDQYADNAAPSAFANGPVEIAQVVPGSASALVGIAAGDTLLSVGDTAVSALRSDEKTPLRDSVFDLLAGQAVDTPMSLTLQRGEDMRLAVMSSPIGCLTLFEITTEDGLAARSDGRVIQITYQLATSLNDEQLAAVFAHELAHTVLEHRRRLSEAGVSKGFFGEFGRDQQLNRQVEIEADRLSVHLLANAGYDPVLAANFWRSAAGEKAGGGLLRSFIYPSATARADLVEREIDLFLSLGVGPSWPGHLLAKREHDGEP